MSMDPLLLLLAWGCALIALLLAVPVAVLLLQVLMALPALRPRERAMLHSPDAALASRPRLAVLVPAHNEALGIAQTLRSVRAELGPGDRLLVVADNCTDDTALAARNEGADVVERQDAHARGKGYALDFGVRHLAADAPEVVLVVDADCLVQPGSLRAIAVRCSATQRPVQALYLMHSPEGAGLKVRIAEFAWRVKNLARPLGYHRLGMPCQLMGSGMAFTWAQISGAKLASGHIVEDLQLGLDLAAAGTPPLFCVAAHVSSVFPTQQDGVQSQRTRWEHGHLQVIASQLPRLVLRSVRNRDLSLFALALDLAVPPLALLCLLTLADCGVASAAWAAGAPAQPLFVALVVLGALVVAVLLAWARVGREVVSFADLMRAPLYALWKIPIYLKFLIGRQVEWVRSKRGPP